LGVADVLEGIDNLTNMSMPLRLCKIWWSACAKSNLNLFAKCFWLCWVACSFCFSFRDIGKSWPRHSSDLST